jgi:hypothetical protein
MPTSKHRRKGKPRPRGKVNNAIPPGPIIDPEDHLRQDAEQRDEDLSREKTYTRKLEAVLAALRDKFRDYE